MKAMDYKMYNINQDGYKQQEEQLDRRNHEQASWWIASDENSDERITSSSSFHHYLAYATSKNDDESSRSSTPNMASEPISCPPSPPESDEDHQVPLEQSIEYYNSMTWCMYYRIMNARKASRSCNKKAHKKSSLPGLDAMTRTNQKQALRESPAGNTFQAKTGGSSRRILNSQSADLATLDHQRRSTATGKQKAYHVNSRRSVIPLNDGSMTCTQEEDIFHLDM